jgi:hypothetical protein
MASDRMEQAIVIRVLDNGAVSATHILEAVTDIEITEGIELSTEPGVAGRIGDEFPRSASFKVRVRDGDPRTPAYQTAKAQHALLRSLKGKLFYVDTRTSPPEKIVWTMENPKAVDDNAALNAYTVDVTVREIIGGEFGEFIDPNELQTETGLVPVAPTSPDILGAGGQTATLDVQQATLRGALANGAFGTYQSGGTALLRDNDAAVESLYDPSEVAASNLRAVAAVTNSRTPGIVFRPLDFKDPNAVPLPYTNRKTHVLVYGAKLPAIPGCTLSTFQFTVLGKDFKLTVDATRSFQAIALNVGDTAYALTPDSSYVVKRAAADPDASLPSRRTDIAYPADMDLFIALVADSLSASRQPFTSDNFEHYALLLVFSGGLAA